LQEEGKEYRDKIKKALFDTEKKGKDAGKLKSNFEAECRNYEQQNMKEMDENYRFKMQLDKGAAFGALYLHRHDRDTKLITDLRKKKQDEKQKLIDNREKTQTEYMAMTELQALITEANKYKDEIEDMHTKHEHLNIKIKEMVDGTEYLQEKKEDLDA
jgi:hypothetical protein